MTAHMTAAATFLIDVDGVAKCQGCGETIPARDGRLWPNDLVRHLSCFELWNRGREAEGAPLLTESSQPGAAGSNPAGSATRPDEALLDFAAHPSGVPDEKLDLADFEEARNAHHVATREIAGEGGNEKLDIMARIVARRRLRALATAPPSEGWLIWSNEHRAWWAPAECGYVSRADLAGRYTFAKAAEVCREAGVDSLGTPLETMVPAPPVDFREEARKLAAGA